jgi:hypothetical protein
MQNFVSHWLGITYINILSLNGVFFCKLLQLLILENIFKTRYSIRYFFSPKLFEVLDANMSGVSGRDIYQAASQI